MKADCCEKWGEMNFLQPTPVVGNVEERTSVFSVQSDSSTELILQVWVLVQMEQWFLANEKSKAAGGRTYSVREVYCWVHQSDKVHCAESALGVTVNCISVKRGEWILCRVSYITDILDRRFFDEKRALRQRVLKVHNFTTEAAKEAKLQVWWHYIKWLVG